MTAPQLPAQFDEPAPIGGVRPRIADLRNRVVFIQPIRIDRNVPGVQLGQVQDRITANVMVVDGGPLEFGGKPEKFVPHTLTSAIPALFEGVYISQTNLVQALLQSLPSAQRPQGGVALGRIVQGQTAKQGNNPPWNLQQLEPNDPARALAMSVLQAWITGAFQNPEPIATGAAPAAAYVAQTAPAHVQAAQQAVAMDFAAYQAQQAALAAGAAVPTGVPMATPSNPHSVQSVAAPAPDYTTSAGIAAAMNKPAPAPGSYEAFLAAQAAAAAPTPPAAPAIPAAPTGWPQAAWESLTNEQRAQILGQTAAQPAAATGF